MIDKLNEMQKRYDELLEKMQDEEIISDYEQYKKLAKEQSKLQPIMNCYATYKKTISDIESAKSILEDESDESMIELAKAEIEGAEKTLEAFQAQLVEFLEPKDERDDGNVIMEIRPAAGGDEAALFAGVLLRMYTMYAQAEGFSVEIYDLDETEIGGVKSVSFTVEGDGAFAKLKYESGVHRVQRVPETETQGRIHTSTCTVAVLPEAVTVDFKIEEKDLRVDVYRASGAGGQHVNKTESAVRITHIPTGVVVACQDGRSQIKNREKAMSILQAKLADHFQEQEDLKYASTRKNQVGTGDRSERIRTYNYPQGRITDHRIGKSVHNMTGFMNGDIGEMVDALRLGLKQQGE
ncbi:MAG: peptide chain release factor 1 [Firmicutes bacterium]|nr:peptide chain release factor 1 [Bacillota bacterium]